MQEKSKITMSIRPYWIATIIICLLCIFPILVVQNPPLHDYPFHIARMYILTHWHGSAALQDHYTIGSFILPNAAMDIVVPLLSHVMPLETAGRVFLALALLLQVTGCVALHRSLHGRYSLWPLVSSLFVFNWIFVFGFTNYLFGIGLVLWSASTLVRARRSLDSSCASRAARCFPRHCSSAICMPAACLPSSLPATSFSARSIERSTSGLRWHRSVPLLPFLWSLRFCLSISTTAGVVGQMSHSLGNLLRAPAIFVRVLFSADWILDIILLATVAGFFTILTARWAYRGRSVDVSADCSAFCDLSRDAACHGRQLGGRQSYPCSGHACPDRQHAAEFSQTLGKDRCLLIVRGHRPAFRIADL